MNQRTNERRGQPDWLGIVKQQVEQLHYGVVQVVVHDSRVVQIDRTERLRLGPARIPAAESTEMIGDEGAQNKQA